MQRQVRYGLFMGSLLVTAISLSCKKASTGQSATTDTTAAVTVTLKGIFPYFLRESSGLCFTNGNLWSFGDSGNPAWLFRIDSSTGAIMQTVEITNYTNTDWEDITADPDFIYIGDFGNNKGNRTDLKILKIKKSAITDTPSVINLNAEAINFSYADQADFISNDNTDFDCESVVAAGDSLYIFSKDHGDLQTRCYALPKIPGTYAVAPKATFNTAGKVTAAAYDPVTHELALLGYADQKLKSFIWFFDNFNGTDFFGGTSKKIAIEQSNLAWQTEGLDFISATRLMMSCETTPGNPASLYSVQKNY